MPKAHAPCHYQREYNVITWCLSLKIFWTQSLEILSQTPSARPPSFISLRLCLPHQRHTRQPLQAPFHLLQARLSLLGMSILPLKIPSSTKTLCKSHPSIQPSFSSQDTTDSSLIWFLSHMSPYVITFFCWASLINHKSSTLETLIYFGKEKNRAVLSVE